MFITHPIFFLSRLALSVGILGKELQADGVIWLRFVTFENPGHKQYNGDCCDSYTSWCYSECEPQFKVCIGFVTDQAKSCLISKFETKIFTDDEITFGNELNDAISNPVKIPLKNWKAGVRIQIEAWDDDGLNPLGIGRTNEFLDTYAIVRKTKPDSNFTTSKEIKAKLQGRNSKLNIHHRVYCEDFYLRPKCSEYCKDRDDISGHYRCDYDAGKKVCLTGWYGWECTLKKQHCEPRNDTQGHYECDKVSGSKICHEGWKGLNCTETILPSTVTYMGIMATAITLADLQSSKLSLPNTSLVSMAGYKESISAREMSPVSRNVLTSMMSGYGQISQVYEDISTRISHFDATALASVCMRKSCQSSTEKAGSYDYGITSGIVTKLGVMHSVDSLAHFSTKHPPKSNGFPTRPSGFHQTFSSAFIYHFTDIKIKSNGATSPKVQYTISRKSTVKADFEYLTKSVISNEEAVSHTSLKSDGYYRSKMTLIDIENCILSTTRALRSEELSTFQLQTVRTLTQLPKKVSSPSTFGSKTIIGIKPFFTPVLPSINVHFSDVPLAKESGTSKFVNNTSSPSKTDSLQITKGKHITFGSPSYHGKMDSTWGYLTSQETVSQFATVYGTESPDQHNVMTMGTITLKDELHHSHYYTRYTKQLTTSSSGNVLNISTTATATPRNTGNIGIRTTEELESKDQTIQLTEILSSYIATGAEENENDNKKPDTIGISMKAIILIIASIVLVISVLIALLLRSHRKRVKRSVSPLAPANQVNTNSSRGIRVQPGENNMELSSPVGKIKINFQAEFYDVPFPQAYNGRPWLSVYV